MQVESIAMYSLAMELSKRFDELGRNHRIRHRTMNWFRPLIGLSQRKVFSFSCESFSSCRARERLRLLQQLRHLLFVVFEAIELIVIIVVVLFAAVAVVEEY